MAPSSPLAFTPASMPLPSCCLLQLPAWPFVTASFGLGCYALLPYMILWSPKQPPQQLPPPKEELVGSCMHTAGLLGAWQVHTCSGLLWLS